MFATPMKWFIVHILFLSVLVQTFSKWAIIIDYNYNKKFIARELCINKNKPWMHCNGKCHLKKRIAKEQENNQPSSGNLLKEKSETQYFEEKQFHIEPLISVFYANYLSTNTILISQSFYRFCFRPPQD